jgi:hypothetical protein
MNRSRILVCVVLTISLFITSSPTQTTRAQQPQLKLYLPALFNNYDPLAGQRVVNVPYLNVPDIVNTDMEEMAVFWFGQVSATDNYSDVRIAYSSTNLEIRTATFDQYLWYNAQSTGANLENYDAVTITLQSDSSPSGAPTSNSWRIVSALRNWEGQANYTTFYQGNGSTWVQKPVTFTAAPVWRGNGLNGSAAGRGWVDDIRIPFSSLGLGSAPASGTVWRIGVRVHDRDTASGAMQPDTFWPLNNQVNAPSTWSLMRFGMPTYSPPALNNPQTIQIYQGKDGAQVPDADVGGGTTCSAGMDFFTQFGSANYAGREYVNIQNQSDVSDWPCFSKYYVTFPLDAIPVGKVIRTAKLVMHQFGSAGAPGDTVYTSFLQASTVAESWDESALTWNHAPLPLQNLASTRIGVYKVNPPDFNNLPAYQWDVSQAAAEASTNGAPLKLVLYTPAGAQHSGKYFLSSNSYYAFDRPTLVVEYGDR